MLIRQHPQPSGTILPHRSRRITAVAALVSANCPASVSGKRGYRHRGDRETSQPGSRRRLRPPALPHSASRPLPPGPTRRIEPIMISGGRAKFLGACGSCDKMSSSYQCLVMSTRDPINPRMTRSGERKLSPARMKQLYRIRKQMEEFSLATDMPLSEIMASGDGRGGKRAGAGRTARRWGDVTGFGLFETWTRLAVETALHVGPPGSGGYSGDVPRLAFERRLLRTAAERELTASGKPVTPERTLELINCPAFNQRVADWVAQQTKGDTTLWDAFRHALRKPPKPEAEPRLLRRAAAKLRGGIHPRTGRALVGCQCLKLV